MYSNTIRIWYDIVIDKDNDYDNDINDDVGQNDFGTSNALDLSISSVWTRSKTVQGALGIRIRPMSSRWNLHTSLCTRNNGFYIYQNLTNFRFLPKLGTQKNPLMSRRCKQANCTKFHSNWCFFGADPWQKMWHSKAGKQWFLRFGLAGKAIGCDQSILYLDLK